MSPIQQMLLGVGAVATKTYVDDVFSTYVYRGLQSARSINNGIDLSGEGGMVWIKRRNVAGEYSNHILNDTVRGAGEYLQSNSNVADSTDTNRLNSFTSTGFTVGTDANVNFGHPTPAYSGTYSSWTFRKAPGFFDVVTWSGNDTAGRQISHSLSSIPGSIFIKKTSSSKDWTVGHRSLNGGTNAWNNKLKLNTTGAEYGSSTTFNNTAPTSTHFTLGSNDDTNESGETYVAYLFAGGESTNALARSVDFDGSDWLTTSSSTDYGFGTGDFTIESWVKLDTYNAALTAILSFTDDKNNIDINASGGLSYYDGTLHNVGNVIPLGQWTHIAYSKEGTNLRIFVNGILLKTITTSVDVGTSARQAVIGSRFNGNQNTLDGSLSNYRIVKGTAVYTSSFRPPTEPLTSISGTSLLCCNNSSVTGATTGTVTSSGDPTASTDSPFDDPAGFVFGENEDQGVIKCGTYTTDSNEDATINLGWEPQWVLAKRVNNSTAGDWFIIDSMRGFMNAQDIEANNGGSRYLEPNTTDAEDNTSRMGLTSTGFYADQYGANRSYIYVAIRRSDGYCGKPIELGSDCFQMDTGSNSSTIPNFDSGFPVDFALMRRPGISADWYTGARLTGGKYLKPNTTATEGTESDWVFDSNTGWCINYNSDHQSWMWKRHAGFDVVTYSGNGSTKTANHSLGRVPEMIWIKARNDAQNWLAYHKGLNGGTTPWNYHILLNSSGAEGAYSFINQPTTTTFTVTSGWQASNKNYIAMLFASVDGISKVGYYTGDGTTSHTITTGFTTRFLIIKKVNGANSWFVRDSLRGLGSGNDPYLQLENSNAEGGTSTDYMDVSSTGFTIKQTFSSINASGDKYIYYAHA